VGSLIQNQIRFAMNFVRVKVTECTGMQQPMRSRCVHAASLPVFQPPPSAPMSKALPLHRARPSRARMAAAHTAPCLASEPWSLQGTATCAGPKGRRSSVMQHVHVIEDGKAMA
jgi:hypothetical protein